MIQKNVTNYKCEIPFNNDIYKCIICHLDLTILVIMTTVHTIRVVIDQCIISKNISSDAACTDILGMPIIFDPDNW